MGNRYGGIQAVVYPAMSTYNAETGAGRIAVQDYSGQSELLLVAGSASSTRLQVQLVPQGGPLLRRRLDRHRRPQWRQ